MRVLVVDDNKDWCECIRFLLDDWQIVKANNSVDCLKELKTGRFDCIIMDHILGDAESVGLIDTIRTVMHDYTPIIVATAFGDEELVAREFKVGANDYLPKMDITRDRLINAVNESVERYHNGELAGRVHSKCI